MDFTKLTQTLGNLKFGTNEKNFIDFSFFKHLSMTRINIVPATQYHKIIYKKWCYHHVSYVWKEACSFLSVTRTFHNT
jgi:hypothetical protein